MGTADAACVRPRVGLTAMADSYQGLINQTAAITAPDASSVPVAVSSLLRGRVTLTRRRAPQIGQLLSAASMRAPHSGQCSDSLSLAN